MMELFKFGISDDDRGRIKAFYLKLGKIKKEESIFKL